MQCYWNPSRSIICDKKISRNVNGKLLHDISLGNVAEIFCPLSRYQKTFIYLPKVLYLTERFSTLYRTK